jgi:two-component system, chemotaxis family, chemotaxis protein CheY
MKPFEHGTVLIADDNEIVRQVIHAVCKKLGFAKIVEAENGAEALEALERAIVTGAEPRLIISDVDMPSMNGLDLLSRVRNHKDMKDIPFILLTAHAEKELVLEAIKIGVTNYLTKPFGMESIEKKIKDTLLNKNGSSRQGKKATQIAA